jgi:aspartate carbamoyltransferase
MSSALDSVGVSTGSAAFTPPAIDGNLTGKHIVSVEQFARPDLDELIKVTADLRSRVRTGDQSVLKLCRRRIMATLFFEASTRTDMSFQAAMLRLGGEVVATAGGVKFSSVYKGENLADSVRAAGSYADVVVLRHPEVRSSYEAAYALDQLTTRLGTRSVVVSGGDGVGEHPTQALLDLFTIVDHKGTTDGQTVTLVGDLAHGRTVHSLAKILALYGGDGLRIELVSPESLRTPQGVIDFVKSRGVEIHETSSLDEVIGKSDVIYWTRVQEERFEDKADYEAIAGDFVMTPDVLAKASADAILMHPLPRKHEMGTEADHAILDNDPRAIYFHQMQNGMYMRMALLAGVLGAHE